MFFVIEISRPFILIPSFYRSKGVTTFRVAWLFFALSVHPMRLDEMIAFAYDGLIGWDSK